MKKIVATPLNNTAVFEHQNYRTGVNVRTEIPKVGITHITLSSIPGWVPPLTKKARLK